MFFKNIIFHRKPSRNKLHTKVTLRSRRLEICLTEMYQGSVSRLHRSGFLSQGKMSVWPDSVSQDAEGMQTDEN